MGAILAHHGLMMAAASGGGGSSITPIIWDSANKSTDVTLTESGKLATNSNAGSVWRSARSTTSFTTGTGADLKFKVQLVGSTQIIIGLMKSTVPLDNFLGLDANGWGYYCNSHTIWNNSASSNFGAITMSTGDTVTVTITSAGVLSFFVDGALSGTSYTAVAYTGLSGTFYPAVSVFGSGQGGRAT